MRRRSPFRNTLILTLPLLALLSPTAAYAQDFLSSLPPASTDARGRGISDIITSVNVPATTNPLNINSFVGADRFYNAGYTGTRVVVTNVEAGHVWGGDPNDASMGHETLKQATVRLQAPEIDTTVDTGQQLGQFDLHATWVGSAIAGRPTDINPLEKQRGIAYGATLWSGAVATTWLGANPYRLSFDWKDERAFAYPYVTAIQTGVTTASGLRRTDVVNSSWGFEETTGSNQYSRAIDGLVKANHTVMVFAAGNAGAGNSRINSPGAGYNSLVVGALGPGTDYSTVAAFSSTGPQDYKGPDGEVKNIRARVDLVAPGQNLVLAQYSGATGGNVGAANDVRTNLYSGGVAGTSFASPIVAGGASLLVDVGYDKFGGGESIYTEVIKSVLLNSATKIAGWTNNETIINGTVTTTQALDYKSGAGALNLNAAFDQYTAGTHNLAGLGGGGISAIGWDYGAVNQDSISDYIFNTPLEGGTTFTATLNWLVGRTYLDTTAKEVSATDDYFTNLDLQLWSVVSGVRTNLIAQSITAYNNTEQFTLALPTTGDYLLRVVWAGERYDLVGNDTQAFGLAWSGTAAASGAAAPEPITLLLFVCGGLLLIISKTK